MNMAWEIDAAHSLVEFSVKHMMVSTVKGRFGQYSGVLDLDEPNPHDSKVDVTIQTGSIDTHDPNRDAHLRSADFFDAEKYPTITFKSTTVEKLSDEEYRVTGDLTMHGVTREVPLQVTLEGQTKDMQGKRRAGFSIRTAVNRKDFGLNWNVALEAGGVLVGEKVNINIEAEVIETADVARAEAVAQA
jgi:polyisoprenoid-binding protein YceI